MAYRKGNTALASHLVSFKEENGKHLEDDELMVCLISPQTFMPFSLFQLPFLSLNAFALCLQVPSKCRYTEFLPSPSTVEMGVSVASSMAKK